MATPPVVGRRELTLLGWTAGESAAGAILGSWIMTDKLKGLLIGVVLLGIAAKMAWRLV